MKEKNRPAVLGNPNKKPCNDNSYFTQHAKLLKHFKSSRRLTTLQAREELGIMHPSGRTRELIALGHNIVTLRGVVEPDVTGLPHRVGLYVYLGRFNAESMRIRESIQSSGISDRLKAASRSLFKAIKLNNQDAIKACQDELRCLMKALDKEAAYVTHQNN
jgi:hypothetical protein